MACRWMAEFPDNELKEIIRTYGLMRSMTPRGRVQFRYADFRLDQEYSYLDGKRFSLLPEEWYRRIQNYCYDHLLYVPMLVYNSFFTSGFNLFNQKVSLMDLSLDHINKRKVVGYREKIDGDQVWRAHVSRPGGPLIVAWFGAMSCPAYFPEIVAFELRGMTAFSISPWNFESTLFCGEDRIEFVSRPVYNSVPDEWEDGAVAIVLFSRVLEERRVKRYQTSELWVENGVAQIGNRSYPCVSEDDEELVLHGVYECTLFGDVLIPIAPRNWKCPDPDFLRKMRLPAVQDLVEVPKLTVTARGKKLIMLEGNGLLVPETLIRPPVFSDPRVLSGGFQLVPYLGAKKADLQVLPGPDHITLNGTSTAWTAQSSNVGTVRQMLVSYTHEAQQTVFGPLSIRWEPDPTVVLVQSGVMIEISSKGQRTVYADGSETLHPYNVGQEWSVVLAQGRDSFASSTQATYPMVTDPVPWEETVRPTLRGRPLDEVQVQVREVPRPNLQWKQKRARGEHDSSGSHSPYWRNQEKRRSDTT